MMIDVALEPSDGTAPAEVALRKARSPAAADLETTVRR